LRLRLRHAEPNAVRETGGRVVVRCGKTGHLVINAVIEDSLLYSGGSDKKARYL
jgi:hypothetical protein